MSGPDETAGRGRAVITEGQGYGWTADETAAAVLDVLDPSSSSPNTLKLIRLTLRRGKLDTNVQNSVTKSEVI